MMRATVWIERGRKPRIDAFCAHIGIIVCRRPDSVPLDVLSENPQLGKPTDTRALPASLSLSFSAVYQAQHVERPGCLRGLDDVRVGPVAGPLLQPPGQALQEGLHVSTAVQGSACCSSAILKIMGRSAMLLGKRGARTKGCAGVGVGVG